MKTLITPLLFTSDDVSRTSNGRHRWHSVMAWQMFYVLWRRSPVIAIGNLFKILNRPAFPGDRVAFLIGQNSIRYYWRHVESRHGSSPIAPNARVTIAHNRPKLLQIIVRLTRALSCAFADLVRPFQSKCSFSLNLSSKRVQPLPKMDPQDRREARNFTPFPHPATCDTEYTVGILCIFDATLFILFRDSLDLWPGE